MYLTHGAVIPPYAAAKMLNVHEHAILFIRKRLPRVTFSSGRLTSRYSQLYVDEYRKYRLSIRSLVSSNVSLEKEVMAFARTDSAREATRNFTQGFTLALERSSKDGYLNTSSLASLLDISQATMRNWLQSDQAKPYIELNPRKFRVTPEDFLKACPILLP